MIRSYGARKKMLRYLHLVKNKILKETAKGKITKKQSSATRKSAHFRPKKKYNILGDLDWQTI